MSEEKIRVVEDKFIHHWGSLGNAWGVNKTMTQIHSLLMVNKEPLTTDDVMDRLQISRGNAHKNLKELQAWGIVKPVIVPGSRKDYYSCEMEPWKLLCILAKERNRREIEPAIDALDDCLGDLKDLPKDEVKEMTEMMTDMKEFLEMASNVLGRLGRSEKAFVLKWLMRLA